MRVKHNLWKVSNGWILVPESVDRVLSPAEAPECHVFKTLKEFSEWKPKRKRNRKQTPKHADTGTTQATP